MDEVEEQLMDSKLVGFFEKHNDKLIDFGIDILSALVLIVVGIFLIRVLLKLFNKVMVSRNVDETIRKFGSNLIGLVLKTLLFIVIADKIGIQTTSFAALIAAAGLGIGFALQGAFGNLAGGVIIMSFKPFKIGDYIEVQGEKGFVEDIQIFSTIIRTLQNKTAYIPNGTLANGNIINISQKGHIRLDLTIGVDYASDIKQTKEVLLGVVNSVELVLETPVSTVALTELADSSLNFGLFIWVKPLDYYPVKAAILEGVKEALDTAGIEIPYPHQVEIHKKG